MNKPLLVACCALALSLSLPSVSEAARVKEKPRATKISKKQPVLKGARAVTGKMALAAKASRHQAAGRTRGLLARKAAEPAVPQVQPAMFSGAAMLPDASVAPRPAPARKPILQRMYASDGDMFYFNGRKYRVEGVPSSLANQEMTKQRLQRLLDSGEVSIEPRGLDDAGLTTAVIRVAGRDVAESLK